MYFSYDRSVGEGVYGGWGVLWVIGWAMGCWLGGGGFLLKKVTEVQFYKRNPFKTKFVKISKFCSKSEGGSILQKKSL